VCSIAVVGRAWKGRCHCIKTTPWCTTGTSGDAVLLAQAGVQLLHRVDDLQQGPLAVGHPVSPIPVPQWLLRLWVGGLDT